VFPWGKTYKTKLKQAGDEGTTPEESDREKGGGMYTKSQCLMGIMQEKKNQNNPTKQIEGMTVI